MRDKFFEEKSCCNNKNNSELTHKDPVCGMGVAANETIRQHIHNGATYYFCNDNCLHEFLKEPERYLAKQGEKVSSRWSSRSPVIIGAAGAVLLLVIFFGVVTLANGTLESAVQEFYRLWYWVLLLAAGFGFQLGLFFHIKNRAREKMAGATVEVAASGAISTGSMIACCTHGLVNLLPILGVSAAAAFLARYQQPLILLGVFSNLVGITIMLGIAKKQDVLPDNLLGRLVARWNIITIRHGAIAVGILSIIGSTWWSYLQ